MLQLNTDRIFVFIRVSVSVRHFKIFYHFTGMPLTEESIRLEYLRKHNIPALLDSIVLQLLEWQPDDPVEFIRNSEVSSARAIKVHHLIYTFFT